MPPSSQTERWTVICRRCWSNLKASERRCILALSALKAPPLLKNKE